MQGEKDVSELADVTLEGRRWARVGLCMCAVEGSGSLWFSHGFLSP